MTIEAKIIADSISDTNVRLTTFLLKYPYWIHQELLTHRMFSRNSGSQRAIPSRILLKEAVFNTALPERLFKNKAGMQGEEELSRIMAWMVRVVWRLNALFAATSTWILSKILRLHKQHANRLLIPHTHIPTVLTGTEEAFRHFFALRNDPLAQPEMRVLAAEMQRLYDSHEPEYLAPGKWHLPFVEASHVESIRKIAKAHSLSKNWIQKKMLIRSVACCARASFGNHTTTTFDLSKDSNLYQRLLDAKPPHASPFEHQAQALPAGQENTRSGNFRGWLQYRKTLPGEFTHTAPTKFPGEAAVVVVDSLQDITQEMREWVSSKLTNPGAIPFLECASLTDYSMILNTFEPDVVFLLAPKLVSKRYPLEKQVDNTPREESWGGRKITILTHEFQRVTAA